MQNLVLSPVPISLAFDVSLNLNTSQSNRAVEWQ